MCCKCCFKVCVIVSAVINGSAFGFVPLYIAASSGFARGRIFPSSPFARFNARLSERDFHFGVYRRLAALTCIIGRGALGVSPSTYFEPERLSCVYTGRERKKGTDRPHKYTQAD